MSLANLLQPRAVLPSVKVGAPRQLLQLMCERAAELMGTSPRIVLGNVLQRERLGSTNVGGGVAIPHGRLSDIDRAYLIFARLENPIYFAPSDYVPVDLVFLLLTPEADGADHLQALAKIARLVRNDDWVVPLRKMQDEEGIYRFLCEASVPEMV